MEARFIILVLLSTTVRGGGRFELRVIEFYNYRGYDSSNGYCDPTIWGGKDDECDPFFGLSFNLNRERYYPTVWTKIYPDKDTVRFGSSLGNGHSNPIRRTFTRWPGSLNLQVTVMDHDKSSSDDLIDSFSMTAVTPVDGREHSHTARGKQGSYTHFKFSVKVTCDNHYYPPQCTKYCLAQHSGNCRYNCDSNGDKQCLRGWRSPSTGCCECFCHNGGTCTPTHGSFRCSCPAEWTGDLCQDDLDECRNSSNPCENGGECINTIGSFKCSCPAEWTGDLCQDDLDECRNSSNPCKNGGKCTNSLGSFTCKCPPGFKGAACENDINECTEKSGACRNGGTCTNTFGSFTCTCPSNFTGTTCADDVDECRITPPVCHNNKTCENTYGSFICDCGKGFTGKTCHLDVDECKIFPPLCKNNGTCTNHFGSFNCSCPVQFRGRYCDMDVDECATKPSICKNGGVCENSFGGFTCNCSEGFTGPICQNKTGVPGGGQVELTLKEFYNARGYDFANRFCDANPSGGKVSNCDPFFILSLSLDMKQKYPIIKTKVYPDVNTVKFGSDLGNGHSNPIQKTFTRWPGLFSLHVTVMDDDQPGHGNLIDVLSMTPVQIADGREYSHTARGMQGNHTYFQFSIKVTCDSGFYAPHCTKYCRAQHSGSCRYNCTSNGDKQCLKGWGSPSNGCCCLCYNGGTCTPTTNNMYICSCRKGFTGKTCHLDVDECKISPPACRNSGICNNHFGSFTCTCPKEFTGDVCEKDVDECELIPSVCKNNGTCQNTHGSFICTCSPQFKGRLCDVDVDECKTRPPVCKNNGLCKNNFGGFTCKCSEDFTGPTCQEKAADAEHTTQNLKTILPSILVPLLVIIIITIVIVIIVKRRQNMMENTRTERSMSMASQRQLTQNPAYTGEENPYCIKEVDECSLYSEMRDPYCAEDGGDALYADLSPYSAYDEIDMDIPTAANVPNLSSIRMDGDPVASHSDRAARFFSSGYHNSLRANDRDGDYDTYKPYSEAEDDYERTGNPSSRQQSEVNGEEDDEADGAVEQGSEVLSHLEESAPHISPREADKQSESSV